MDLNRDTYIKPVHHFLSRLTRFHLLFLTIIVVVIITILKGHISTVLFSQYFHEYVPVSLVDTVYTL